MYLGLDDVRKSGLIWHYWLYRKKTDWSKCSCHVRTHMTHQALAP
jgi:hypothetical protein